MEVENDPQTDFELLRSTYAKLYKICWQPTCFLIGGIISSHSAYANYKDIFASFSSAGNILNTPGCIDPTSALAAPNDAIFSCLAGLIYLQYYLLFLYFLLWINPLFQYMDMLYVSDPDGSRYEQHQGGKSSAGSKR